MIVCTCSKCCTQFWVDESGHQQPGRLVGASTRRAHEKADERTRLNRSFAQNELSPPPPSPPPVQSNLKIPDLAKGMF
jgi:hypothetical protein